MIIFSVDQPNTIGCENNNKIILTSQALSKNGTYTIGNSNNEIYFITNQTALGKKLVSQHGGSTYLEQGHYGIWYLMDAKTDMVIDYFKRVVQCSEAEAKAINSKFHFAIGDKHFTVKY